MKGRRPIDEAHGLSPAEQEIVTRIEAGESHGSIAKSLGLGLGTIMVIARRYIIGDQQLNGFERRCRQGEAKYRAALAVAGKVYA